MVKKIKWSQEELDKLNALRDNMTRYQNILHWQKLRRVEKKLLKLKLRYDYRSYRREYFLDKYLVSLRYKKPKGPLSEED